MFDTIDFQYSGIGQAQKPQQKQDTLDKIKLVFIIMPICMLLLGILIAFRFNVTPERHTLILNELKRLEAGGARQDASEETKAVYQLLIGKADDEPSVT